jgi:hypothetical protein
MTKIYIAGPMTGLPGLNFAAFHERAAELRALGHTVINPAEINPDHSMAWSDCMRKDIAALVTCDQIDLLGGWQQSKGATLEHHIAERLGLTVSQAPVPVSEFQRLHGEAGVMRSLLSECAGIILGINPESSDESDLLDKLHGKLVAAIRGTV